MRIIKIDQKNGEIRVIPQTMDDLWHLEKIIEKGDIAIGKTDRKIKPKNEGEKAERKTIFVEILIEEVRFQEFSENLKINGIIIAGKPEELIELKSYQSLDIKPGDFVTIRKKSLKKWHIERLFSAERASAEATLLVALMDDEECELAFVNQFSLNIKAKILSKKQGKMFKEEKSPYFEEVLAKIIDLKPKKILIAGPGFTRDNFRKFIENKKIKNAPKIFVESTNSIGEPGFRELLASGKIAALEKELQIAIETKLIEEFLEKISKGLAEYGPEKVQEMLKIGAAEKMLISEKYLLENRKKCENLMDAAEKNGSEIHIISSKNPNEKQIHGFGGIVVTLRYKME
ncbi:MAG: mRNA surveillance protein pelota [archaeon]|jgi:protein pelota